MDDIRTSTNARSPCHTKMYKVQNNKSYLSRFQSLTRNIQTKITTFPDARNNRRIIRFHARKRNNRCHINNEEHHPENSKKARKGKNMAQSQLDDETNE